MFFSFFIGVIAVASSETIYLQALNSTALSQFLAIGFIVLFELVIFVPTISTAVGIILGNVETHELVTDRNLRQLEL